jgi:hypothetical protein
MSQARLIYIAVFVVLIVTALLPALAFLPDGFHDGGEI